jgi:hypothetical protein
MNKLPRDKLLHIAAGVLIFLTVAIAWAPRPAAIAVLVIGASKELLWDSINNYLRQRKALPPNHDVDPWDFLATVAGGMLAWLAFAAYRAFQ